MTSAEKLPNVRQQIHDIFVQLQERFRNHLKRQPISLIDALAFTNMAHDYAMSDLDGLAEKLQKDLEQYKKDRKRCLESEPKEQFIACQLEGKIIVAEEVLEALKP